MEPVFVYFNKLKSYSDKKFKIKFSNDDEITKVLCKKCKDYFISMDCFIELSNNITKSSQFFFKKEGISDLANNILISGVDFGFRMDELIVKDFLWQDHEFKISKKYRSHFTESIEFFDLKINETRKVNVYSPYDQLKATQGKF